MTLLKFKIITPERVVHESDAAQVSLPTGMGEITILPGHMPLVATVAPGEIVVRDNAHSERSLAVSGGFIQVDQKRVTVMADTAEMADELQEEKVREAHERAEKLLAAKGGIMDRDWAKLKALMDREFARLKVARKHKTRGLR